VPTLVIVGAGSAGATLAGRLTERRDIDVVLLEAGPAGRSAEVDDLMRSPNPGRILHDSSPFVWPELVATRTSAQQPYRYWRGRGLGGTSSINGQIAIRPGPEAFADWPLGWEWDDVLPAFVRLEDDDQFGAEPYHGVGGPIPIYRAPLERWEPIDVALREAALAVGHPECPDHNAPTGTGVSPFAINSRDGRRVSTDDAYLTPAKGRPNLRVIDECLVDRIVLDGAGAAVGVIARVAGESREFEGDAVVLAAGAIHSPAILQRSGIGPAKALRDLAIPVIVDLPVGETLMEHPIAYCVVRLADAGRASSIDARHTNCTVRYSSAADGTGRNDMMLIGNNLVGGAETSRDAGIVGVALEEARSTGTVRITSPDPGADPAVDLGMLSESIDLDRMRDGARRLFDLARHDSFRRISTSITAGRSTAIADLDDDATLDGWLLRECVDGNHAAASCPMGPVLDADCRVHGVDGLFVVDASSFPTIPPANPHLAVVMLAEVIAERLRDRLVVDPLRS
jgi:5-(hydroxymethyl)furfural/furfural oxidase